MRLIKLSTLKTLAISIICSSCASTQPEKIHPKFWPIDSNSGSLVRAQEGVSISCKDEKADDYVAISYQDLSKIFSTYVIGCSTFRSSEELQRLLDAFGAMKNIQDKF